VAIAPVVPKPEAVKPATTPAKPLPAKPVPVSSARLAAVKAIERPQTADAGDDEYSYGYRLWEAKFFPEAAQQLQIFMEKFPRHARTSYARNLLGRAYLDDGKPREAAGWFLKNYQTDKKGARAPDSLLMLAEAMTQLKDTNRACVALGEFSDGFPQEAAGRLKSQYDATRASAKCN
jgi:TolA-binding protein